MGRKMFKGDDWVAAAAKKLPSNTPLENELKPVLEKLVREQLRDDLLKPAQLTAIAQTLLKYCRWEKPK